jgi:predicted TPR repeat methyltransferase
MRTHDLLERREASRKISRMNVPLRNETKNTRVPAAMEFMMTLKPKHFSDEYARIFQDASVIAAYQYRPPYPQETFEILAELMDKNTSAQRILDAGCGTGQIASRLHPYAKVVDFDEL